MPDFPSTLELALRVGLAFLLGAVVGFEREVNDHPAGLRTHVGVALGACLFGIVSAYGFTEFNTARANTNHQVDVSRIASQIVTGMGFLGGGAILKYGPHVRGLTTAASIWVTAAIGLAVAVGSYVLALVTTAAVLLSLVILRVPKAWIDRHLARQREVVVVRLSPDGQPSAVVSALTDLEGIVVNALHVDRAEDGTTINMRAAAPMGTSLERLVAPIADRRDVTSVELG